jgi:hypothetical protein
VKKIILVAFWCAVFLAFLTPMELGDVWWHMRTGQWILQHHTLPQEDPFSIYTEVTPKNSFVLKGFWLCQIMLYGIYRLFDFYGLIVLKSVLFTSTFFILHRLVKGYGLKAPLSYIVLIPVIYLATYYDEIRPQTFSFFFFALTIYLLERKRGSPPRTAKDMLHCYWPLFAVMPLWSNIHPGFVIGDAIIVAYMLESIISSAFKKPRKLQTYFIIACLLSVALSSLNPNGLKAIIITMKMLATSAAGSASIHEHLPLKEFASFTHENYLYLTVIGLIVCAFLSFILRIKTLDILHLFLVSSLSYTAIKSFRAGIFFAIFATVAIGRNLSILRQPRQIRHPLVQTSVLAAIVMVMILLLGQRTILTQPVMNKSIFPLKAAAFIETQALPGNIYHPYEWGGYLIWRLYPEYRVFIDGRALGLRKEHTDVLLARPQWEEILERYGVNTVLYWPLLPYRGNVPPIIFALLKDDAWSPVYWDLQCIIFVRTPLAKNPIKKDSIWELLTSLVSLNIRNNPSEPDNYIALAEIYLEKGLKHDAKDAFRKALALEPTNQKALFWMQVLE